MAGEKFCVFFAGVIAMLATAAHSLLLGFDELSQQFLPLAHVSPRCLEPIDYVPPHCSASDMVQGEVLNDTMWYYSPDLLTCVSTLKFTGCATDNRFDKRETCSKTCESGTHCPPGCHSVYDPHRRHKLRCVCPQNITEWLCHLPADGGDCRKISPVPQVQRYYFDAQEGTCKAFTFSRCGGNQNNFGSLLMCKDVCAYEPEGPSGYHFARLLLPFITFIGLVATALHLSNSRSKDQPSNVMHVLKSWVPLRKPKTTFSYY